MDIKIFLNNNFLIIVFACIICISSINCDAERTYEEECDISYYDMKGTLLAIFARTDDRENDLYIYYDKGILNAVTQYAGRSIFGVGKRDFDKLNGLIERDRYRFSSDEKVKSKWKKLSKEEFDYICDFGFRYNKDKDQFEIWDKFNPKIRMIGYQDKIGVVIKKTGEAKGTTKTDPKAHYFTNKKKSNNTQPDSGQEKKEAGKDK